MVVELMKSRYNQALDPHFYFYRDVAGQEVDLIVQKGSRLVPIEIKSSKTFSTSFLKRLEYFHKQTPKRAEGGALIYAGNQTQNLGPFQLFNVENCSQLLDQK